MQRESQSTSGSPTTVPGRQKTFTVAASASINEEPSIAIYYFGDAFTSPFNILDLSQNQKENGILTPQVVPFSSFRQLPKMPHRELKKMPGF